MIDKIELAPLRKLFVGPANYSNSQLRITSQRIVNLPAKSITIYIQDRIESNIGLFAR